MTTVPQKESKYILPFYLDNMEAWNRKHLHDWSRTSVSPRYLAQYITEFFAGDEPADNSHGTKPICSVYYLRPEVRSTYGFPDKGRRIGMQQAIFSGQEEYFSFNLQEIRLFQFVTGMCFLELSVFHEDEESLEMMVNENFALVHMLGDRIGAGEEGNDRGVRFFSEPEKKEETGEVFLQQAVFGLLGVGEVSFVRSRFTAFHRLILQEQQEGDEVQIRRLCRGQHSNFLASQETEDDTGDFYYTPTENIFWAGCANGVVSLSYDLGENTDFIRHHFPRNVNQNYYLLFLIAMNEREIMLHYNYEAVRNWNNAKQLVEMRKKLVRFDIMFAYNTVSEEPAYQRFYESIYQVLRLNFLEKDIQEVVEKVDEYTSSSRERRVNVILGAIAVLSVFSAASDGLSFIDRVLGVDAPLGPMHYVFLGGIAAVVIIDAVMALRKK